MCSRLKKIKTILIKDETKKTIDNIDIIYNIKSKEIGDISIKKIYKRKSDNISDEESDNNKEINKNIIPSFDTIKSSVYRYISRKIPKDIDKLSELTDDSKYYVTERGDNYLAYKSDKKVLFISKFQTQLIYKYNQHCFVERTFYSAPKSSYQIINIRIHNIKEVKFYTVANTILENKEMAAYIEQFLNLNIYIYDNRENKRNIEPFNLVPIHCYF